MVRDLTGRSAPASRAATLLLGLLFGLYVVLLAVYVVVGRHWTDEGWYLNAARLVAAGQVPYLDFAFTQAPGFPYLYALPQVVFGPSFWVGRLTSLAFALGTGLFTLYAARRLGGPWGAILAFGFFALNIYNVHFLTVILTYPAATFFLTGALAALTAPWPAPARVAVALVAAALATGIRFSAAVPFAALLVYALLLLGRRPLALFALLPGLAGLGLIFGPFLLADPVVARFNILGYHVEDASLFETIWRSRFYWINFLPGHLAWAIGGPLLLVLAWRTGWRPRRPNARSGLLWMIAGVTVAITILHALPENPQAKYQTLIAPWACVLLGAGIVWLAADRGWSWATRAAVVLPLIALPFALQVAGNAVLAMARGELSPRFSEIDVGDGRLPLAEIESIGDFVAANTPPGEPVATLFTSIAVAANRPVLPGLEMSIFSLTPAPAGQTERLRLTTPGALTEDIAAGRPAAIITEQTLLSFIPQPVIDERYCLARRDTGIGQFQETVDVYLRRSDGRCPGA